MELQNSIQTIYQTYFDTAAKVLREAKPGDGLFGLGDDPKKHGCHQEFYDLVEQAVTSGLEQGLSQEEAGEVVALILRSEEWCGEQPDMVRWMLVAAQGLALPLIPQMSWQKAANTLEFYRTYYPVFRRMPVQKKVLTALKQAAQKKEHDT